MSERIVLADQPPAVRPCSIAAALEILGERWTLLASRDMLADRLRKLESAGIAERRLYSEHPPRYEYHLTQAGRELFPVMQALREWGDKWAVDTPAVLLMHDCGHPLAVEHTCQHCGKPVTDDSVYSVAPSESR
jgi:DNA-binding HxlR family transcriptional regulator